MMLYTQSLKLNLACRYLNITTLHLLQLTLLQIGPCLQPNRKLIGGGTLGFLAVCQSVCLSVRPLNVRSLGYPDFSLQSLEILTLFSDFCCLTICSWLADTDCCWTTCISVKGGPYQQKIEHSGWFGIITSFTVCYKQ